MRVSFFIPGIKFNVFFGAEVDKELSSNLSRLGINTIFMYRSFRESCEYQQLRSLLVSELSPKKENWQSNKSGVRSSFAP